MLLVGLLSVIRSVNISLEFSDAVYDNTTCLNIAYSSLYYDYGEEKIRHYFFFSVVIRKRTVELFFLVLVIGEREHTRA